MISSNSQEVTDAQLLLEIKKGNELAFNTLYTKYWKRIFAYALHILNDKGLAEDVVHDVFSNLWFKKETIVVASFENYLFVAVKNKSISLFRKVQFTELDEAIMDTLTFAPEIDHTLKNSDLKMAIERAVRDLPNRCSAIFYMSRYDDYSNAEIANHFKISQRTVENQLYLALKHVRSIIGKIVGLLLMLSLL